MDLKYRERQILLLLLTKKSITGRELSEIFNVSTRTIRSDIKTINRLFQEYSISISSNNYLGYFLDINENQRYVIEKIINSNNLFSLGEPIFRDKYIILKLLMHNKIYILEASEKLFVSISTIISDLKRLELDIFAIDRDFTIQKNYNQYSIHSNEEKQIRMYFSLILNKKFNELDLIVNNKSLDLKVDFGVIKALCLEILNKNQIIFTDRDLKFLCIYLMVFVIRKTGNYRIKSSELTNLDPKISSIVNDFAKVLGKEYGVTIEQEDRILLNELYNSFNKLNKKIIVDQELNRSITEISKQIDEFYGTNLAVDIQFTDRITAHLESYISKKGLNLKFSESIVEKIRALYPFSNTLAEYFIILINEYPILDQIRFDDIETALLSVHFQASIERNMLRREVKALLVCSYGIGTSMLLETQLKKQFKNMEIVATISSFAYELIEKDKVDIIISTTTILDEDLEIPIVHVQFPLTFNCIESINSALASRYYWIKKIYPIIIDLPDTIEDEEKCIEYMDEFINYVENRSYSIAKRLLDRERMHTTYIGRHIAMPHALIENGFEYNIYLFKSSRDIKWGEGNVKLVFCILINQKIEEYMNEYIKIVNAVYEKISIEEIESPSVSALIDSIL